MPVTIIHAKYFVPPTGQYIEYSNKYFDTNGDSYIYLVSLQIKDNNYAIILIQTSIGSLFHRYMCMSLLRLLLTLPCLNNIK